MDTQTALIANNDNLVTFGICDAKGGRGEHTFRTALNDPKGTWRVVATDYVTGQTAVASFAIAALWYNSRHKTKGTK